MDVVKMTTSSTNSDKHDEDLFKMTIPFQCK